LFLLFPDTPYTTPKDEQRHGVVAPAISSFTGESKWIGQFDKLIPMPIA
jgi:hypothetical protein